MKKYFTLIQHKNSHILERGCSVMANSMDEAIKLLEGIGFIFVEHDGHNTITIKRS